MLPRPRVQGCAPKGLAARGSARPARAASIGCASVFCRGGCHGSPEAGHRRVALRLQVLFGCAQAGGGVPQAPAPAQIGPPTAGPSRSFAALRAALWFRACPFAVDGTGPALDRPRTQTAGHALRSAPEGRWARPPKGRTAPSSARAFIPANPQRLLNLARAFIPGQIKQRTFVLKALGCSKRPVGAGNQTAMQPLSRLARDATAGASRLAWHALRSARQLCQDSEQPSGQPSGTSEGRIAPARRASCSPGLRPGLQGL